MLSDTGHDQSKKGFKKKLDFYSVAEDISIDSTQESQLFSCALKNKRNQNFHILDREDRYFERDEKAVVYIKREKNNF